MPSPERSPQKSAYITDYYTTKDSLNFSDFHPALVDILRNAQTPLTVGVFGAWGSGKTSLLRILRQEIEQSNLPSVRTVWFTAWKYDRQEALWRAFILSVLDALYPRQDGDGLREARARLAYETLDDEQKSQVEMLDRLQESIYRPVDWQELGKLTVDWVQLLREGGEGLVEVASAFLPVPGLVPSALKALIGKKGDGVDQSGIAGGIRREVHEYHRQQLASMEQFGDSFAEALQLMLGDGGRLVVFVDDLDRCLPEKAVEILEAIKLFLEVPGTIFVLGMDREVIERGIETRYGSLFQTAVREGWELPISGDTYLQKIIQIPFHLPPLAIEDLEQYIGQLEGGIRSEEHLSERTRAVFARGLYANPRQVKRAINIFRLLKSIALAREERGALPPESIAWPLLAKTVVIQLQYPELYQSWRRYPTLVQTLESAYGGRPRNEEEVVRGRLRQDEHGDGKDVETATESTESGGLLGTYLRNRQRYVLLEQMLCFPTVEEIGDGRERALFANLSRAEMHAYVRLAGSVETSEFQVELPEAPQELLSEMCSGDRARAVDAVRQLEEQAVESDAPLRQSMRQALAVELSNEKRSALERASAGYVLGLLGDSRPGVGLVNESPDIDWVEIGSGSFEMGEDEDWAGGQQFNCNLIREPYRISRYPITVAQFHAFVDAGGYAQKEYWTDSGWQWRAENDIQGPKTYSEVFQTRNHPQVGVSWYEAVAFCQWLSKQLGYNVFLPTEAQWERAARHTDARLYPWGDEFDAQRCNIEPTGIGNTSAVGIFPDGKAECGAADMSGNVWEWCSTKWLNDYNDYERQVDDELDGTDRRVLRGGAFYFNESYVRCAFRVDSDPDDRLYGLGYRCAAPALSDDL